MCKLEKNWKGACFHMADAPAISQCTKCGYEKGNEL